MPKSIDDLLASLPPQVASWYSITAEAVGDGQPTRAKVNIYDAIGGWWGTNATDFVRELDALDVDELEVHVNSPGGAVWDGLAIMNSLKAHRARVTIIVDGLAASVASIVAMAGDEVVMAEGSQMMIHRAASGAWGNAAYLRDTAAILDKIDGNMAGIYARRAGGSPESWLDLMDAETWYNADEAVTAGLADRTDADIESVDAEAAFDLSRFAYAGRSHAPAPTARQSAGPLRAVALAHPQAPVSSEPGNTTRKETPVDNAEFLSGLRSRLGVTNAQSDETEILAALDEALAEQATEATTLPDGVVAIESGVLSQLQADASAGRQALEAQTIARRDGIVTAALAAGKITAAQKQQWRDSLDKDEEGITALLASMAAVVSVDAKAASAVDDSEDALYTKAWGTTQKEG